MKNTYQHSLSLVLILLTLLMLLPGLTMAQENSIAVTDEAVDSSFRDHLTFALNAESEAEIVEADLLYRVAGQVASSRNQADFTPGTAIEAEFTINQTEPGNYFPPGTEIEYWWKLTDAAGNELTTDKQTMIYIDDRYDWQSLQNDRLSLYWYEGSDEFGQNLFDRANESLDTLENDMGVTLEAPAKLFIYANHDEFMDAYHASAQEWTGGAAFDEYGVVMMTVEPRQPDWGTVVTAHELAHLVVHRATDNYLTGDLTLPRWLDEGIAVYTSGEVYSRPDFKQALQQAINNDQLLTLRTLSSPFGADTDEAILSYAQSGAVVKFIIDAYGPKAMSTLLNALAEGALYDEALEQALNMNTDQLDNAFRKSVDLPPLPDVSDQPASTVVEPAPTADAVGEAVDTNPEPVEKTQESASETVGEVTENTEDVSPTPPAAEAENSGFLGLSCCLAGIIPLLFLSLAWVFKR